MSDLAIRSLEIAGFKSIADTKLALSNLNVIIGANGSGKSNLISAFDLLSHVLTGDLQLFVAGDPDRLLHHGRILTPCLKLKISFCFKENLAYCITLKAVTNTLIFEDEHLEKNGNVQPLGRGYTESVLSVFSKKEHVKNDFIKTNTFSRIMQKIWGLNNSYHKNEQPSLLVHHHLNGLAYHFCDTSSMSSAKRMNDVDDNLFFRQDGSNLTAYLYFLQEKHPTAFHDIQEQIRLVAPFFDRFILAPSKLHENKIKLEWRQKGSDAYFEAYSLSDGTLRFICLATLLLQPDLPQQVVLDEPELGLHPFAICVLADMLKAASRQAQVILATQSVTLLNQFSLEDIIVAENDGLKTNFKRLDQNELKSWLDEFSVGELWEKNLLGGRP